MQKQPFRFKDCLIAFLSKKDLIKSRILRDKTMVDKPMFLQMMISKIAPSILKVMI